MFAVSFFGTVQKLLDILGTQNSMNNKENTADETEYLSSLMHIGKDVEEGS